MKLQQVLSHVRRAIDDYEMIQENRMELAPTIGTESAEELPQEAE